MRDLEFFMRALCKTLLLITWALWFGGVMGLFLSVQVLFHQTDRAVFLASAPRLFIAFERYQLMLAATSLLLTCGWQLISPFPRFRTLFTLVTSAALGAVVETTLITPRIEALRIQGASHTPEFMRLHGLSMCVYMAVAITLLIAGVVLSFLRPTEPGRPRPDFAVLREMQASVGSGRSS
jgi:hypothetical protein